MTRLKVLPDTVEQFETEAELRQAAKKLAEERGYQVIDISWNRELPKQFAKIKADWVLRNPKWDKGMYALAEWKLGEAEWSSDEQELRFYEGKILVFRYLDDFRGWMDADQRNN